MKAKYEFEWNVLSLDRFISKDVTEWGKALVSGNPNFKTRTKVEVAFDEWLAKNNTQHQ